MKCFLCERTHKDVLLVRLPVEVSYDDVWIEIIGNALPNECICLPCVGYQIDYIEDEVICTI